MPLHEPNIISPTYSADIFPLWPLALHKIWRDTPHLGWSCLTFIQLNLIVKKMAH